MTPKLPKAWRTLKHSEIERAVLLAVQHAMTGSYVEINEDGDEINNRAFLLNYGGLIDRIEEEWVDVLVKHYDR